MAVQGYRLLFLVFLLGALQAAKAVLFGVMSEGSVVWDQPQPDLSETAGYDKIAGVEHYEVFRYSVETGVYNNCSQLLYVDGTFFAAWSSCDYFEDSAGERVLVSVSSNGKDWSDPFEGLPALGPPASGRQFLGRRTVAPRWVELNGDVYLMGWVCDWITYSSGFNSGVDETDGAAGFYGVARRISSDGQVGPLLWIGDYLYEPFDGFAANPRTDTAQQVFEQYLTDFFMAPSPVENMKFSQYVQFSEYSQAADGRALCEPMAFRRNNGEYVVLWRGRGSGEHKMYASFADSLNDWSVPVITDIPDAPSKCCGGKLPDGRFYLVGNQTVSGRDPLTLTVSPDGLSFDWTGAIRTEAPTRDDYTHPVTGVNLGKTVGFQYPGAAVVGDSLWVLYSITKENIAISRIPLASLPSQL